MLNSRQSDDHDIALRQLASTSRQQPQTFAARPNTTNSDTDVASPYAQPDWLGSYLAARTLTIFYRITNTAKLECTIAELIAQTIAMIAQNTELSEQTHQLLVFCLYVRNIGYNLSHTQEPGDSANVSKSPIIPVRIHYILTRRKCSRKEIQQR